MRSEESPNRRAAIPTQRGRKRQKLGGTLQRFWAPPRIGPPRSDTRPAAARQPKGEYPSVPDTVVDHRPAVSQKPLTASALALLEFHYRLNVFVMATEEKAPVEWAAERILGVRKARAYAILREIGADADLEAWLRQKVLVGMGSGRIGRGRQTRPCAPADAAPALRTMRMPCRRGLWPATPALATRDGRRATMRGHGIRKRRAQDQWD